MMQAISATTPVSAGTPTPAASTATPATPAPSTQSAATSAFGLGFDSLLKIILTQLTYQDPLKPMDNFQFVSQLAQFSQIQIGQTTNDRLSAMVSAQATMQAAGLFGRTIDILSDGATVSGKVTAIALAAGEPKLTIETDDKRTIAGLALGTVSQIR